MSELKYKKYVVKIGIERGEEEALSPKAKYKSKEAGPETKADIFWERISQPFVMESRPMVHEFDQILCFMGGDNKRPDEFGAEVEFSLGKESEKHIITEPTVVYVEKGLIHCPLNFKKVDKPIILLEINLTSQYFKKEVSD